MSKKVLLALFRQFPNVVPLLHVAISSAIRANTLITLLGFSPFLFGQIVDIASTSYGVCVSARRRSDMIIHDAPTTTRGKVLLRSKRHVRRLHILSFARQLRMFWIIVGHVAGAATTSGVLSRLQCRRDQIRRRGRLCILVRIT